MYLTADIQAREPERARLAAAFDSFVAAGKQVHHLPGPGEHSTACINHPGAPATLPPGEQNQHMHRQPRNRQKALDQANWEGRQALIERYRERILDAAARDFSEAGAAMELRISRAQVRMIATAVGVTLRMRAKRKKVEPTFHELVAQEEAKPALSELDLLAGQLLAMAAMGKTLSEARQAAGLKPAKFREICDSYGSRFEGAA